MRFPLGLQCQPDAMTLQGDYYNGYSNDALSVPILDPPYMQAVGSTHVTGENIIYRWKHTKDEERDWTFQAYFDRTERHPPSVYIGMDRDLFDLDFQHRFPLGDRNGVIWGVEYRFTRDSMQNSFAQSDFPPSRFDHYYDFFAQDQITLVEDKLFFIAGSKFDYNPYTNFEYQPTGRILWTPTQRQSIWASVSRAVHVPDRNSVDGVNNIAFLGLMPDPFDPSRMDPGYFTLLGNPHFLSEDLLAWELGVRTQATEQFSWDLALFFNQYSQLQATVPLGIIYVPGPVPYYSFAAQGVNAQYGETYGAELAANYTVNERWRLQLAYTYLRMFLCRSRCNATLQSG